MELNFYSRLLEATRRFRTWLLRPLVLPLKNAGVKAYHLTFLSLVFGLLAVYFLFRQHAAFVAFGIAHLLLDALDGVLARETKVTPFGAHFDNAVDRVVEALVLLKGYLVLGEPAILAVLLGVVVHQGIFILSRLRAPTLFIRTTLLGFYFFGFYLLGAVVVGVVTLVGLALQVAHYYHLTVLRRRT